MSDDPASAPDQFEAGMKTRRAVLGDAYVDGAEARKTGLDADFQRFIAQNAWGAVWSRPGFTLRERSLVTLAVLAATGSWDEFELHTAATVNTGATAEDLAEMLMHVAVYAGVPRANTAMKVVKRVRGEG